MLPSGPRARLHDRHAAARTPVPVHAATSVRRIVPSSVMSIISSSSRPDEADRRHVAGLGVQRVGDHAPGGPMLDGEVPHLGPLAVALLRHDQELLRRQRARPPCRPPRRPSQAGCRSRRACRGPSAAPRSRGSGPPAPCGWRGSCRCGRPRGRPTAARRRRCRLMAISPLRADLGVLGERGLLDHPAPRRHDQVVVRLELGSAMIALTYSPDSTCTPGRLMIGRPLAWRLASGSACTFGDEHAPAVREEQDRVVRVRDEKVPHGVLLAGDHRQLAPAAAPLAAEGADRLALDVAALAQGDDHVLAGDEVLRRSARGWHRPGCASCGRRRTSS